MEENNEPIAQANTEKAGSGLFGSIPNSQPQQKKNNKVILILIVIPLILLACYLLFQVVYGAKTADDICKVAVVVALKEGLTNIMDSAKIEEHDGTNYYFVTLTGNYQGTAVNALVFLYKQGDKYSSYFHLDEYWTNGERAQWKLAAIKNSGY